MHFNLPFLQKRIAAKEIKSTQLKVINLIVKFNKNKTWFMNHQIHLNARIEQRSQFFSPEIPEYLPPHKMYKIQIGGELFLLSGASISSDGPHSYFLDFFQKIEYEQQIQQRNNNDINNSSAYSSFDSNMVNVDVQERILFVDRDPEIFRYIYNHLQGYYINIPNEIIYTKLFSDAMYYRLPRLRGLLKNSGFYYVNIGGQSFKVNKQLFKHKGNDKNYFKITAEMIYQDIEDFFINQEKQRMLRPPPQTWAYCSKSPEIFKQILVLLNGGKFEGTESQRHNLLKEIKFYRLLRLEQEVIAHKFFNNPFNNTPEIFINLLDIKADSKYIALTDLKLDPFQQGDASASSVGCHTGDQKSQTHTSNSQESGNTANLINSKKRKLNPTCQLELLTVDDVTDKGSQGIPFMSKKSDTHSKASNCLSEEEESISKNTASDEYGLNDSTEFRPLAIPWKVFSYKRPFLDAWGYPLLFQIGNAAHLDEEARAVNHCFVNTTNTIDDDGVVVQTKPQQSNFFADPDCMVHYGTLLFDAEKHCCFISFEGLIARRLFKLLKLVLPESLVKERFVYGYSEQDSDIINRIILPSCVKFATFILDNKPVKNICGLLKQKQFLNMLSTEQLKCNDTNVDTTYYKIPLCDRSVWRIGFKKVETHSETAEEVMMIGTKIRCGSIKEYNNYF